MRTLKSWLVLHFIICTLQADLNAQNALGPAGGDTSGSGGTIAYSIGQVAYTSIEGETGNINQGVQQPYDIITVSTGEPEIAFSATLFPNPATTAIQLNLDQDIFNSASGTFTFWLYDPQGRLMQHQEITSATTIVAINELSGSVYFLRITLNENTVKTFRIFKTN